MWNACLKVRRFSIILLVGRSDPNSSRKKKSRAFLLGVKGASVSWPKCHHGMKDPDPRRFQGFLVFFAIVLFFSGSLLRSYFSVLYHQRLYKTFYYQNRRNRIDARYLFYSLCKF